MKNLLVLLLLSVALSANAQDKKNNRPTSYNYMRGVESVQNEKTEKLLNSSTRIYKKIPRTAILIHGLPCFENIKKNMAVLLPPQIWLSNCSRRRMPSMSSLHTPQELMFI